MPARKPLVFDRTPGQRAAAESQPPRVAVPPSSQPAPVFDRPQPPSRVTLPEPYTLGQRVECGGFRLGRVFNVCPCVCPLGDKFVYVVELDTKFKGSPYFIGHSSEVNPIGDDESRSGDTSDNARA